MRTLIEPERTLPHQSGLCDTAACRCVIRLPSAKYRERLTSHARAGRERQTVGLSRGFRRPDAPPAEPMNEAWIYHTTQVPPWKAKERRRARNRAARATRRRQRR